MGFELGFLEVQTLYFTNHATELLTKSFTKQHIIIILWCQVTPQFIKWVRPWLLIKLAFEAVMYFIWKERNNRLHNNTTRPVSALIEDISRQLRAKLDILSRRQPAFCSCFLSFHLDLFILELQFVHG